MMNPNQYDIMQTLGLTGVDQQQPFSLEVPQAPAPKQTLRKQDPMAPLLNVVRPQQPQNGDYFQQLLARSTQGLADQREGIKSLENDYNQFKNQQSNPWVAALAGASDVVSGGNMAQQYLQSENQRRQGILDMGNKLQSGKDKITSQEIDLIKAQYEDQNKKEQLRAMRDIAGMRANAAANKPKDLKNDQVLSAGFGKRMEQAEQIFGNLAAKGYNRTDRGESLRSWLPGEAQSEDFRSQDQAERNFVNALLRKESGSAIGKEEFKSAEQQYFPRPGDTRENLAQKAANRRQAIEMMKLGAGPAWEQLPTIQPVSQEGLINFEDPEFQAYKKSRGY